MLILGLGIGTAIGDRSADGVTRGWERRLTTEAFEASRDLQRTLRSRREALSALADMPSIRSHSADEAESYAAFLRHYPVFAEVYAAEEPKAAVRRRLTFAVDLGHARRLFGTLAPGWPQGLLPDVPGLGWHDEAGTILVGSSERHTESADAPPSWKTLRRTQTPSVLIWKGGRPYLTVVRDVPLPVGSEVRLVTVSAVSTARLDAGRDEARRSGLLFGLALGLTTGLAAWAAIGRSTRRLRRANDALERRVADRTAELALAERSFRGIFENVPLGLYQCDPEGRFIRVNPSLARTLGYDSPETAIAALGSLQSVGEPRTRAEFLCDLRIEGEVQATMPVRRADGATIWLAETARTVRGEGEACFIEGTIQDATAQREFEDRLRQLGSTDPLTGLLNRRGLEEAVEDAALPVSFVVLDIDGFKAFNDTYGHPAGDRALKCVANALRNVAEEGVHLARAGGEEFVVVLSRSSIEEARRVAETLRKSVAECDVLGTTLTVSGGVASAMRDEEIDEALLAADRALYRAKRAGRNRIVVNAATMV